MRPSTGGDRPEAAVGLPGIGVLLAGPTGEQARTGQLLHADGETHVALAGTHGHDRGAQSGGARGAGVGHVVDGDARLADLLLQLLTDARGGVHEVPRGEHTHVAHGHPAVGQGAQRGLGGQVHHIGFRAFAELGHVDAEDPDVVVADRWIGDRGAEICGVHACAPWFVGVSPSVTGSKPNPMASVPSESAPIGSVVSRTFIPVWT